MTLDEFIDVHDKLHYGCSSMGTGGKGEMTDFARVMALATIRVDNHYPTVEGLRHHLDSLDLMDEERLRPGWDTYFMVSQVSAPHVAEGALLNGGCRRWRRWRLIGQTA